jgi:predicted lipase
MRHMDDVLEETKNKLGHKVIITGHSLGAARARVFAALRVVNHLPVDRLCVFGSPRPGFANLARVIQKSGMIHMSFRNRNDPVTEVPTILPQWEHTENYILLDEHAIADDYSPLRDHHIELYQRGVNHLT